ncbi:MAG TPA: hypothetical protein VFK28_07975 [Sphingomicrobium sp.]|jgi:hypothetical protein|nr:hypothetical protein [Sphingomicrobium sp.]
MTRDRLRPTLTMSEIFGPNQIFFPRAHDGYSDWLPDDPAVLDALTGGSLTIAGDMPIVCSAGHDTPAGLDLMARAGLEVAQARLHFKAGRQLDALAAAAARPDTRIVFQHALPPGSPEEIWSWIDPALLRFLNDKANLAQLAPPENVPRRRIVDRAQYFAAADQPLPSVLKIATDQSTGGGLGVAICHSLDDLRQAARTFEKCERIVVEEMLDIVRNPCLNFAVMPGGEVRYLGFADQEVTPEGRHYGNWLDLGRPLDEAAIEAATEPVRRAAAMGYRGLAGVDLALTSGSATYVLDLNFRFNASTAAILLAPAITSRSGATAIHLRRVQGPLVADHLADAMRPFVASGGLIPLNLFDAEAAGHPGKSARSRALVVGASREVVEATEAEMAAVGLS